MNYLIEQIKKADEAEIDDILEAAIARKRELYPEWDLLYAAGKRNDPDHWERMLELIQKYRNL